MTPGKTPANPRIRAVVVLAALAAVVFLTTAAGMHGNPGPGSDVVRSSYSGSWRWIVAGALVGVGAIAFVLVRRRRRQRVS
jgi:hypothetical protein